MVVPNFEPGIHEREFEKRFGRDFLQSAAPASASSGINLFVCFTNRCGSNLFAESLASSGKVPRARELFNHRCVAEVLEKQPELKSFPQYCAWQAEVSTGDSVVFPVKVSSRQLAMLGRCGVIPSIFPGDRNRFLFLRRRDLLAQAISLDLAQRTEGWQNGAQETEPVAFNARRIVLKTQGIAEANARFETLFALNGIEPLTLFYEDLVAEPAGSIAGVGEWLGEPEIRYVPEKVSAQKQHDPRKDEWRRLFTEVTESSVNPR